jgi:urea carboxylase-associated protein 2
MQHMSQGREAGEPAGTIIHSEVLRGGDKWSGVIRRGRVLRLVDTSGRGAVAALFFNAAQPLERYNMPDTLKAQYTAYLTAGRVLHGDMGHALLSVVEDGCGWHDTISGHLDAAGALAKYGEGTYQRLRNDRHRNTRDNFVVELAKHGLDRRDLHANVNWFVRVAADADGRLRWVPGNSKPGAAVALRAELDTLVVLSNTPHPLDPAPVYSPPPVELTIVAAKPPGPDDPCRLSRPENTRAFALSEQACR